MFDGYVEQESPVTRDVVLLFERSRRRWATEERSLEQRGGLPKLQAWTAVDDGHGHQASVPGVVEDLTAIPAPPGARTPVP